MQPKADGILGHLLAVAPIFNDLVLEDSSICITDLEKVLYYMPAEKLDLKIRAGLCLRPEMAAYAAINEKRRIVRRMPASLHGIPFIAIANPVCGIEGEVVGAVVVIQSVELQEEIKSISKALEKSMAVIAGTVDEVYAQTNEIAELSKFLAKVKRDGSP
ncbi:hypothetical protein [Dendrosporobacter sp. 1207_IL3150]|uniref:hypothetical protein n=1 Tax=Dendrosporobacter sp. 1207_IL3150 TaxID=3084054 RepID=UPI002FD9D0A6